MLRAAGWHASSPKGSWSLPSPRAAGPAGGRPTGGEYHSDPNADPAVATGRGPCGLRPRPRWRTERPCWPCAASLRPPKGGSPRAVKLSGSLPRPPESRGQSRIHLGAVPATPGPGRGRATLCRLGRGHAGASSMRRRKSASSVHASAAVISVSSPSPANSSGSAAKSAPGWKPRARSVASTASA